MTFQPGLHSGMLVSAVVVHHQELLRFLRRLDQEFPGEIPLHFVAMPFEALSYHSSLQDFQRREQSGRPIALVVMRHGAATTLLDGQTWLRAVQRLDLALFIYAQHDRLLGWIQVQTHHIRQLLQSWMQPCAPSPKG